MLYTNNKIPKFGEGMAELYTLHIQYTYIFYNIAYGRVLVESLCIFSSSKILNFNQQNIFENFVKYQVSSILPIYTYAL